MRLENNNLNFYSTPVLSDTNDKLNGIKHLDPVFVLDIENIETFQNPSNFSKVYVPEISAWCISASNSGSAKYCNFYYDVSHLEGSALSLYSTFKTTSGNTPLTINNIYYTTSSTYHGSINKNSTDFVPYYNNGATEIVSGTQYAYIQVGITSGTALIKDISLKYYQPKNTFRPDPTLGPIVNHLGYQFRGGNVANTLGLSGFDVDKSQYVNLKNVYGLNTIRWEFFKHNLDTPQWDFYDWDIAKEWVSTKLIQLKKALNYCAQNKIKVIVDMHNRFGLDSENGAGMFLFDPVIRERNFEMWRMVVSEIKGHPAVLAYGIINEPSNNVNATGTSAQFNEGRDTMSVAEYQELAAREILKIDPNAKFSVTCTRLSKPEGFTTLKPLKYPAIYELHNYFTGDYTVTAYPTSSVAYPGYFDATYKTVVNKDSLRKYLQPVRDFQLTHNVPIYVGEFGVVRWAQNPNLWIQDCIDLFEEYNWNYTAFEFFSYNHSFNPEYAPDTNPSNTYAPKSSIRPTVIESVYNSALSASTNLYTVEEMTPTAVPSISAYSNATSKLRVKWPEVAYPLSAYNLNYTVNSGNLIVSATSADNILLSGAVGDSYNINISCYNEYGSATSQSISSTITTVYPFSNISATMHRGYSVRLLTSAYNGPLVRVVRSDASEKDISASSNGVLDISALSSFISAGTSGTVRTWYDQSGNGKHLTQSNGVRRSLIAANGIVYMNGSLPALEFNGAKYYADGECSIYLSGSTTFAAVKSLSGISQQDPIWCEAVSGGPQVFQLAVVAGDNLKLKSNMVADSGAVLISNNSTSGTPAFNGNTNILTVIDYYNLIEHRVNSDEGGKTVQEYVLPRASNPLTLSANSFFAIGGRYRGGSVTGMIESMISEVVIYETPLDNATVRYIETNMLDAYN